MNILIIFCLLLLFWGFIIEPRLLVVKKLILNNPDLSNLKIVFISDLHMRKSQKKRLQRIVDIIKKQNPDIVLCGGDYVNGYKPENTMPIEVIAKKLGELKPKYGFYTVLGNHDIWQNPVKIRESLKANNIEVLENSSRKLDINGQALTIAGVEDLQTRIPDIDKTLRKTINPIILLSHNPDMFFELKKEVFLTLSGHNHGGQVQVPLLGALIVPSKSGTKYANGIFKNKNNTLIVTKGIGNSIMNIRFCCIPEIVVIHFKNNKI